MHARMRGAKSGGPPQYRQAACHADHVTARVTWTGRSGAGTREWLGIRLPKARRDAIPRRRVDLQECAAAIELVPEIGPTRTREELAVQLPDRVADDETIRRLPEEPTRARRRARVHVHRAHARHERRDVHRCVDVLLLERATPFTEEQK